MSECAPLGLLVTGRSEAVVAAAAEVPPVEDVAGALAEPMALMLVENVNSIDTAAVTDRKSCEQSCY